MYIYINGCFNTNNVGFTIFMTLKSIFPDTIKKWKNLNISVINNPPFSHFKNSIRQIPTKL